MDPRTRWPAVTEIAEGDWAAKAVRDAVQASHAAVIAVVAATTAASAGS